MIELADVADLKSVVLPDVPVQVRLRAPYALVMELVDVLDSKSSVLRTCGFESHPGHSGEQGFTSFHFVPPTSCSFYTARHLLCLLSPTAEATGLEPVQ